jgi:ABC-type Fe3+ transport system substrate-binding protein
MLCMRSTVSSLAAAFTIAGATVAASLSAALAQNTALSPELRKVVDAAHKEGVINIAWAESSFGGAVGAKRFETEINKKYGTKISIRFIPMAGFARVGSRVATELSAKQPAFTDIWLSTAAQIVPIMGRDILLPVKWNELMPDLPAEAVDADGTSIKVATGFSGADYNTQLAPMVPKTLEDFLRPEWKGKIATTAYAASFDVLAANGVWGRERTLDYVRKLQPQVAGLMDCAESERIATGEYAALVMNCLGQFAIQWRDKGAPINRMIPREGAARRYYYLSIPRNAPHSNAARLFISYIMSPEGQKALWDFERLDFDALPTSQTRSEIGALLKEGVKFTDVTVNWVVQNPEVNATKDEIIRMLRSKSK